MSSESETTESIILRYVPKHGSDSIIQYYQSLDKKIREQLIYIQENFIPENIELKFKLHNTGKQIYKRIRSLNDPTDPNKNKLIAKQLAILEWIEFKEYLLNKNWYKNIYCFDDRDNKVYFDYVIHQGHFVSKTNRVDPRVVVVRGTRNNRLPVVIKWSHTNMRNMQHEIDIYKRLRKMNCPVPWFSTSFQLLNTKVLVLEELQVLGPQDDEFEMSKQIIQQLKYLHEFGCHNDIKPGNIMRRKTLQEKQENSEFNHAIVSNHEYFLIDHGGVAIKRFDYGYKRWTWTPKFTSQKRREHAQITTPKNDLLELGYTMKAIQAMRLDKNDKRRQIVKSGFDGKLKKYMDYVVGISDKKIMDATFRTKVYSDLLDILSEKK
jgi:hypothetical protein